MSTSKPSARDTPYDEASKLDMTKPDDCLRWALGALELVENGLRNRRKLEDDDVEMSNLRAVKTSIEKARSALSGGDTERLNYTESKAATIYCSESGHWVFVDERAKTRKGAVGVGVRGCIDAAIKEAK